MNIERDVMLLHLLMDIHIKRFMPTLECPDLYVRSMCFNAVCNIHCII